MRRHGRPALLALLAMVLLAVAVPGLARSSGSFETPRCRTAQLRVRGHFLGEAMGRFTETLTFVNRVAGTCRLAGWPSVLLSGRSETAIRGSLIRVIQGSPTNHPFRPVTIRPGGTASFDVYGPDYNAAKNRACPTAHVLLVKPPGDSLALRVGVKIPACRPVTLWVAPLIAGSSDRGAWVVVWRRPRDFIIGVGHSGWVRGAGWPGDRLTCRARRDAVTVVVPRSVGAVYKQRRFPAKGRLALSVSHARTGRISALCRWR